MEYCFIYPIVLEWNESFLNSAKQFSRKKPLQAKKKPDLFYRMI